MNSMRVYKHTHIFLKQRFKKSKHDMSIKLIEVKWQLNIA